MVLLKPLSLPKQFLQNVEHYFVNKTFICRCTY